MKSPLLVVGAARSGTTLIAERLLGSHPDVHYWSEPNFVWRYGNAFKLHDMLQTADCRPHVRERIRAAFEHEARCRRGALLVEKTPANSYRMPFVLRVLPEARILHVVRDGRQAARSAREEWSGRGGRALDSASIRARRAPGRLRAIIKRDFRLFERYVGPWSVVEIPAYLPRLVGLVLRQVLHASWLPWGPRFPGILSARWNLGLLEVAGLQWQYSVQLTRGACARLGPERYMEVRFEQLQQSPRDALKTMSEFAGLEVRSQWLDAALARLQPRAASPTAGLSDSEVERLEAIIGATLTDLGYGCTTVAGTGNAIERTVEG